MGKRYESKKELVKHIFIGLVAGAIFWISYAILMSGLI